MRLKTRDKMTKSDLGNISDEELYGMLSSDRNEARKGFDELYKRYSSKVFTYCKKVMGDTELAEDIFQETFTKFFESASKTKIMTNVSGYLIKIARNLCLNEKSRRQNKTVPIDERDFKYYENTLENKEMSRILDEALKQLPDQYREVLILKEFMDLSYNEIAAVLDTTLPVIRIRIYRAKNKLREIMYPYIRDLQQN